MPPKKGNYGKYSYAEQMKKLNRMTGWKKQVERMKNDPKYRQRFNQQVQK